MKKHGLHNFDTQNSRLYAMLDFDSSTKRVTPSSRGYAYLVEYRKWLNPFTQDQKIGHLDSAILNFRELNKCHYISKIHFFIRKKNGKIIYFKALGFGKKIHLFLVWLPNYMIYFNLDSHLLPLLYT